MYYPTQLKIGGIIAVGLAILLFYLILGKKSNPYYAIASILGIVLISWYFDISVWDLLNKAK
jgi:hypothetical protein